MNTAKEIDAFVHQCFDMYGLNFKQFFSDLVDEEEDEDGVPYGGELVELPLVVEGKIDAELLAQAATTLGLSPEVLTEMDTEAARVWYKHYPYFALRRSFDEAREHSRKYTASKEQMLLAAIFDDDYHPDQYRRYRGGIKERLLDLLKAYEGVMPGSYHEGSEINRLSVATNNFTHFDRIVELAESYLSMVDRARALFYKLWNEELPEDEIREYNFLVSVLGMRDVGYSPANPIYYETARKFAPVYKKEGYGDYSSYIMYRGADFPAFYTCKEFFDHPELVERVVREFPQVKGEIGRMAVLAKNFLCSFVWSDDPEPPVEADFDEYLVGVLHSFGEDAPSWYHRVYVPKTEEELSGDEAYVGICERLSAPPSKGGLKLTLPECQKDSHSSFHRMQARIMGGSQHG